MNVQEAIKSDKPFRRSDLNWMIASFGLWIMWYDPDGKHYGRVNLKIPDILADDWEVKQPSEGSQVKRG